MSRPEHQWMLGGATLVEFAAALVVGFHVLMALVAVTRRDSTAARLFVADGVLSALSFTVAGSLLKLIALTSWHQIGMFAFVLVLRTSLKYLFAWEQRMLRGQIELQ